MKNAIFVLSCLFLFAAAMPASAQHYAGIVGGLNIANLDANRETDESNDDLSNVNRPGFGAVVGLGLRETTFLHLEPMYLEKGAMLKYDDAQLGQVEADLKSRFIEVPVLLRQDLSAGATRPFLMAGPTFGFNLSSKANLQGSNPEAEEVDLKDLTRTVDVGLMFGGGVSVPMQRGALFFEGHYALGLTDVLDDGEVEVEGVARELSGDVKHRGLQVKAGITIPFGASS